MSRELGNTVWVMGAGFSRPLGGPLLTDLFSEGLESVVKLVYGSKLGLGTEVSDPYRQAIMTFRFGSGNVFSYMPWQNKTNRTIRHWLDAEEYLDKLEQAVDSQAESFRYKEFQRLVRLAFSESDRLPVDLNAVLAAAKRWIAAECSLFLHEADTSDEKWGPYTEWARAVSGNRQHNHTFITFNYDLVPLFPHIG